LTKTYFFLSKPFQSCQKQLPLFQAIPVEPKSTSDIPSYFGQAKTDICLFKPFKQAKTDHAIQVSQKPTFSILSRSSQSNIVNTFVLLSLPCRS
jgi:hypothetical protein